MSVSPKISLFIATSHQEVPMSRKLQTRTLTERWRVHCSEKATEVNENDLVESRPRSKCPFFFPLNLSRLLSPEIQFKRKPFSHLPLEVNFNARNSSSQSERQDESPCNNRFKWWGLDLKLVRYSLLFLVRLKKNQFLTPLWKCFANSWAGKELLFKARKYGQSKVNS